MDRTVRALLYSESEVDQVMEALRAADVTRDQVKLEKPTPQQQRQNVESKQRSAKKSAIIGAIGGVVAGLLIGVLGGQGSTRNVAQAAHGAFGHVLLLVVLCGLFLGIFGAIFAVGMNKLSANPVNESSGAGRPVLVIQAKDDKQAAQVQAIIAKRQGAAPIDSSPTQPAP